MSRYILKLWKLDGKKKILVVETSYDSTEDTADEIAEQAYGSIQEAVETNG